MKFSVELHATAVFPWGKCHPVLMNRRNVGPQNLSGHFGGYCSTIPSLSASSPVGIVTLLFLLPNIHNNPYNKSLKA
jgi:hypothetical protein